MIRKKIKPAVSKEIYEIQCKLDLLDKKKQQTSEILKKAYYEYHTELKRFKDAGDLINDISIRTLNDLSDVEKNGTTSNPKYRDIKKLNSIRESSMEILENSQTETQEYTELKIDLLQLKINEILKNLDKDNK